MALGVPSYFKVKELLGELTRDPQKCINSFISKEIRCREERKSLAGAWKEA